jgi:putative ABC transport system permease protein
MRRRPRPRRDDEVDAELAFHIEMQTRRYERDGLDRASARRRALDRLGPLGPVRRQCRRLAGRMETDMHRDDWLQDLRQDAPYAFRLIRKSPLFTAAALVTIALGVGASTAVFSVVNDVLLRRLPYPDGDRTVVVWNTGGPDGSARNAVSPPEFTDIRETRGAFDAVAALRYQPSSLVGGCDGPGCDAEQVGAYAVSPQLFDLLGVRPQLGRPFVAADGEASAAKVVMLSDALWRRRFAGDAGVIGRAVTLAGIARTVVGVMPPGIRFPDSALGAFHERADVWIPYNWEQARSQSRGNQILLVLARLAPGQPATRAQSDLDVIASRFRAAFPDRYAGPDRHWRLLAVPLRDQIVGRVRPALVVLLGAVGLVLLIACANVTNLMLARGRTRERELAVRCALGAGRGRLVRQLLVEAGLVSVAGGALGVLVSVWGVQALVSLDPTALPRLGGPAIDLRVLAFAAAVVALTGFLIGLGPALRQSRVDLRPALADGPRSAGPSPLGRRLRGSLVVCEVAMALVVLVGTGLLVRSYAAMTRVDTGFDPAGTLVFQITLPRTQYDTAAKMLVFDRQLVDELGTLPGATRASAVYPMPMSGEGWSGSFDVEGLDVPAGEPEPHAEYAVVMPGYFATLKIPLVAGREFTPGDTRDVPQVVVVDETLARRYWPGQPAVGKRLNPNGDAGDWATVVGVVAHVRSGGPQAEGEPQIYQPIAQRMETSLYYAVRTSADPASLAGAARAAVRTLDPALPVAKIGRLSDLVAERTAPERFTLLLFVIFGGVALTLAGVGLSGVMSFLVSQRRREIGIRLALGGRPAQVARRVVGEAAAMAGAGVVIGVVCAIPLSRAMNGLLFGVQPTDTPTYAGIALLLIAVAVVASLAPARRATRVDPVDVLRL